MPEFSFRRGEYLGAGDEKIVWNHATDPDHALGMFKGSEEESVHKLKARYYLMKLLGIFFPENIADIHLAASKPHAILADKADILRECNYSEATQFWKLMHQYGFLADTSKDNYAINQDGKIVFFDVGQPWDLLQPTNQKKGYTIPAYNPVLLANNIGRLPEAKKKTAQHYFERLEKLRTEEEANINTQIF